MDLQPLGAVGEVTGSCHLIHVNRHTILIDCGMFQGGRKEEHRNREPFPFEPASIDAVILTHAHIDHSGRLPLLIKAGYRGPIYTHPATTDLCRIMLKDAAYLAERDAEWENRKRQRKHLPPVEPLYTVKDVDRTLPHFQDLNYRQDREILPGVSVRLQDAGHILGSAIVELWLQEKGVRQKIVFSGDLGHNGAPILRDVTPIGQADHVVMESTYGNRQHKPLDETIREIESILEAAWRAGGNVLIPAFAVGRTQEILYLFRKYYREWNMSHWEIFLDSPMAIDATEIYTRHFRLYDKEATALLGDEEMTALLPNLIMSMTPEQSMRINNIHSGAIIVAGSGMCNGGRIRHHFKHNLWRRNCHVIISGFQARGTLGRQLVDGAKRIRLWGETIAVGATIHTVGGLSAHADQDGLCDWYAHFQGQPPVLLVHGEPEAQSILATRLRREFSAPTTIARPGTQIDIN